MTRLSVGWVVGFQSVKRPEDSDREVGFPAEGQTGHGSGFDDDERAQTQGDTSR